MKQTLLLALACHILTVVPAQSPPGFKWVKTITFVTTTTQAEIFDFCTNQAGNAFVYGVFSGALNFGPGVSLQTAGAVEAYFVARYAPNGVLEWVEKIVAPNNGAIFNPDFFNPAGISADNAGNVYISGQLSNSSLNVGDGIIIQRNCTGSCSDFFVAKYDAAGQVQWVNQGSGSPNNYQTATRLVAGTDGSVFVAGNYSGKTIQLGTEPGYNDLETDGMYMARYSAAGQPVNAWFFNNGDGYSQLDHLAITPQNNILITGYYDGNAVDFGNGIGLQVFGGSTSNNYFVAEYNDQGVAQRAFNLNSNDMFTSVLDVAADTSGQPYVVVDFASNLNSGDVPISSTTTPGNRSGTLLQLVDSIFQPVVTVEYSAETSYPVANVALDIYNRYFVSGFFMDAQLNVGNTVLTNADADCDDILLLSGHADSLQWVRSAGGIGCEAILSYYFGRVISTDQAGDLYAAGSFRELKLDDFEKPGDGLFVTKLSTAFVGIHDPALKNLDLVVSPNPNTGHFQVQWPDFSEPAQFTLYDAQGRRCYQRLAQTSADLDFQVHLPSGFYTLEWLTKNQIGQKKLMITH